MKKLIVLTGLVAATVGLSQAAEVKELWEQNCAKCHGAQGKGDTKMGRKLEVRDLTDEKVQAKFTDEQAFKSIKEGVTVDGKEKMKAYGDKLSDQEIKQLVAHIRSLKK